VTKFKPTVVSGAFVSSAESSSIAGGVFPATRTAPIPLLQFLTSFAFGGTERQVITLMRGLDRSRFEPRFACLKRWGQFLGEIEQQRIPVSEYRITNLYRPGTLWQMIRFALDMRPSIQIVHSYNFYGNVFAVPAARLAGVPVVIASIRDLGMDITPAKMFLHKLVCRLADRIVVNAEAIREWLIAQGMQAEKITVIRNGIDLSRFGKPANGTGVRLELGLPEQAPVVLLLGRLTPQKGIETFLESATIVNKRCPDAHFVVVGDLFDSARDNTSECDVSYRDSLMERARQLGLGARVLFTGYRSDIPDLLAQATLSVSASHSEGLSNALMESMAAGVPVVATCVGGSPEVVGEDGIAGLLVPTHDAPALAQAMCTLLEDAELANRMGQAARSRVTELFSIERMVLETERLYESVLKQALRRRRKRWWKSK
jgi:glycosyltransferase involved in cell wall biosynthesis